MIQNLIVMNSSWVGSRDLWWMDDPDAVKGYSIYRAFDYPVNWIKLNANPWSGHFYRDQVTLQKVTYTVQDSDWRDKGTLGKWVFQIPDIPYADVERGRPHVSNNPQDVQVLLDGVAVTPVQVQGLDRTIWLTVDNELKPGGYISDLAPVNTGVVWRTDYSGVQKFQVTYNKLLNYVDIYTGMVRTFYCYSDDTEVMTKNGWKKFQDCTADDEFAARQIGSKKFEWQKASSDGVFKFRFDGEMVSFKGQSLDLLVTPNHRMLINRLPDELVNKSTPNVRKYNNGYRRKKKEECVVDAALLAKAKRGAKTGIATTSVWGGVAIEEFVFPAERVGGRTHGPIPQEVRMSGDNFCAFMGMYLAEGSVLSRDKGFIISQPDDVRGSRKLFNDLLNRLFSTVCSDVHGLVVHSCTVGAYLRQFGHADKKFIPEVIRNATPAQLEIFWKYYYAGDGATAGDEKGSQVAFTVSSILAGQLTEIIQKMGSSSTSYTKPAGRYKIGNKEGDSRVGYFVTRHARTSGYTANWKTSLDEYHGDVFCVSVPYQFLYVRRNGKACWSGNTVVPVGVTGELHQPGIPGSKIVNTQEVDEIDYMYAAMVSRNEWLFEQVGEPAYVMFRKTRGELCGCRGAETGLGAPRTGCPICFEVGIVGGYYGPYDIIFVPPDSAITRELDEGGGTKATRESRGYLTRTPIVQDGDLLIRRTGDRMVIHGVIYKSPRGILLQQDFTTQLLPWGDTRYLIPINTALPTLYNPVISENPFQGIDPLNLKGNGEPMFDARVQPDRPWGNEAEIPIGRTISFGRIQT